MSESLNKVLFYCASRTFVNFVADLWDSEYARTELIQIKLFWTCLIMRFINNMFFFRWLHDFFDFSDTEILNTILTNNELNVEIVILRNINLTVDLTIKSSVSETSSFIIMLIRITAKLDEILIENLINFVFLIIVLLIFSSESDIKFLLNEILNEIIISFFLII